MYVFVSVCWVVYMRLSDQKRISDPLEVEFKVDMSCPVGVLGN